MGWKAGVGYGRWGMGLLQLLYTATAVFEKAMAYGGTTVHTETLHFSRVGRRGETMRGKGLIDNK